MQALIRNVGKGSNRHDLLGLLAIIFLTSYGEVASMVASGCVVLSQSSVNCVNAQLPKFSRIVRILLIKKSLKVLASSRVDEAGR